ncbi:MFS transporter, partial [Pseudomonas syringae]
GYCVAAFAWAYVSGMIPGDARPARFGSKTVYAMIIFTWSLFTLLQGYVGEFGVSSAIVALFMLRFLVGLAESPSFPGNARIVAAWFPTAERGTASAIFNWAPYLAPALFAPLMGWMAYTCVSQPVFVEMGLLGTALSMARLNVIFGPRHHPSPTERATGPPSSP